jgi:phytol kinase
MNDVFCGVLVNAYVVFVMVVVEKLWKGDQAVGRKILHMSMGGIVFLLWLLTSPWTGLIIAGTFVIFSLLITQRMQLYFLNTLSHAGKPTLLRKVYRKIITKLSLVSASDAGNEFGLVYYCLAYTVLAFLFYDRPVVIAAGMLPLAFGDGMGAVIGRRWGAHKYQLIDRKSVEGSIAVFAGTAIAVFVGMVFYSVPWTQAVWKACAIGVVTMLIEAAAPRGLDNIGIPLCATITFLLLEAFP